MAMPSLDERLPKPRRRRYEEGASLTEYALLIGLIAITAVLAVAAVGTDVFTAFDTVQEEVDTSGPLPPS